MPGPRPGYCKDCKHAKHHPAPGEPPKPQFGRFLGMKINWGVDSVEQWSYDYDKEQHENWILCRRFPKAVDKRKTSTCGEFEGIE